jgi:hypothetical protein
MSATPIVSAFTSQAQARPLLAWSSSQMRQIQAILQTLVGDWHAAWAIHADPADVHVDTVVSPSLLESETAVTWQLGMEQANNAEAAALYALQTTLFGGMSAGRAAPGAGPSIAHDVARAAWMDWTRRLESTFGSSVRPGAQAPVEGDEPDGAPSRQTWSGALCASFVWCGTSWRFSLPGTVVQRLLHTADMTQPKQGPATKSPDLVHLADALDSQTLEVRAELAQVTLSLGELETLSIGDVVMVPHQLSTPLQLIGPQENVLCEAWLGKQSGQVAIELVRQNTAPSAAIHSVQSP